MRGALLHLAFTVTMGRMPSLLAAFPKTPVCSYGIICRKFRNEATWPICHNECTAELSFIPVLLSLNQCCCLQVGFDLLCRQGQVSVCLLLLESGFPCVALASLEPVNVAQADSSCKWSFCTCLPRTGVLGLSYHPGLSQVEFPLCFIDDLTQIVHKYVR